MPRRKTEALIEWSRTLQAELTALYAESRALIARGRERLLTCTSPRLRPIRGGSDDPIDLVEVVLKSSPVCGECVAVKTRLPAYYVEVALKALVRISAIQLDAGPCASCHRPGAFRVNPNRPA
jgi:hypothetical protein